MQVNVAASFDLSRLRENWRGEGEEDQALSTRFESSCLESYNVMIRAGRLLAPSLNTSRNCHRLTLHSVFSRRSLLQA